MAYEVTATKKRPQLFDELAGQEFVVSTLKSSLSRDRIAHAYLFAGPRGVGKTSAARILARAVNCQEGPTSTPCGVCSSCVEIAKGRSLDVIEIDGASNTSVNDIREIRDEVLFAPNSSRYKVYIIDEVHMLSNSAFNALLKTIEEPPPYIIFIFATTEIHKVPATIRSRCQQFNFRLIPVEVIKDLLASACVDDGIQAEEDALFWIAKEATGSMRDGFTLFDQVAAFSDGEITLEKIREKLGLVGLDKLNTLVETIISGEGAAVMEQVDAILFQGVAVEQFVGDLGEYFRNLLFMRHGVRSESLLGYNPERFSPIAREAFTVEQLELTVEMILKLFRDLRFSLNQRYELELLLSRIAGLTSYLSPKQMLGEIKRLKAMLAGEGSMEGAEPGGFAGSGGSSESRKPLIRIEKGRHGSAPPKDLPSRENTPDSSAVGPHRTSSNIQDRVRQAPAASVPPPRSEEVSGTPAPAADPGFDPDQYAEQAPAFPVDTPVDPESAGASAGFQPPPVQETAPPAPAADVAAPASPRNPSITEPSQSEGLSQSSMVDMEGFKAEILGDLKRKKLTLSSALEKAIDWQLTDKALTFLFNNDFPARVVRQEQKIIGQKIQEMMGWNLEIRIKVVEAESEESPLVDEQVQAVKKFFAVK